VYLAYNNGKDGERVDSLSTASAPNQRSFLSTPLRHTTFHILVPDTFRRRNPFCQVDLPSDNTIAHFCCISLLRRAKSQSPDLQTMRSSLKERLYLLPEIAYKHVFRASAGGEDTGASYLDFSVLSVAVTTLGLILLVQLVRQRLDRNATGRPFFKTVLEGVYRECKFILLRLVLSLHSSPPLPGAFSIV
jgi:hypothetical protein